MGRRSPSTETNRQGFLRRPERTKGCRANDDDDDDDGDETTSGSYLCIANRVFCL